MKIKIQFLSAALLVLFALGCASHKNKIVFTDDGSIPRLTTNSFTPPMVKGLNKTDVAKIESQVFGALLTRHFWDDGNYTAIFLQADDAEIEAMQKMFPDRVPPIKAGYRANLRLNRTPLDKDTGKPAMILSVDVSEPDADGAVPAIGKWYAGGAVTGFYSFILKKNGDDWEIQTPQ
jgi:hypothetical protein